MELLGDAGIEVTDDEPLVREVMKRVAKRLIREKMAASAPRRPRRARRRR